MKRLCVCIACAAFFMPGCSSWKMSIGDDIGEIAYKSNAVSLYEFYGSMEELFAVSEYVVYGECVQTESFKRKGDLYTRADFVVKDSLYGGLEAGRTVGVYEPGASIRIKDVKKKDCPADFDPDGYDENDLITFVYNNEFKIPLPGDRSVLFLARSNIFEDGYTPLRIFEGEFDGEKEKPDETEKETGEGADEGVPDIFKGPLGEYTLEEFREMINEYTS